MSSCVCGILPLLFLKLAALQACVEQLARLQEESKARGRVCSSIRTALLREINNDEAAVNDTEEYKRQLEVASQRWKPESSDAISRNTEVKKLREMVRKANSGDDDDEVVVQMTTDGAVGTCPVTQGPLDAPLRNRECGHVYSTVGIIGALCQGNNVTGAPPKMLQDVNPLFTKKCPRAGCAGQVNASMLERDYRTENTQRIAQRRAATQQQEDNDDDIEVL